MDTVTIAVLYVAGDEPIDTITVEDINPTTRITADQAIRVTVRVHTAPNEYTQMWTFRGEDAREQAMNKALRYAGWGELVERS